MQNEGEFAWHEDAEDIADEVWDAWLVYHEDTEFWSPVEYELDPETNRPLVSHLSQELDPDHPLSPYGVRAITTHGPAFIEWVPADDYTQEGIRSLWERFRQHHAGKTCLNRDLFVENALNLCLFCAGGAAIEAADAAPAGAF